jgi:hypothetical protein
MVVTDTNKRVIIWGYKESQTQVKAPLMYVAPNVFRDDIELTNGVTIHLPSNYLGSTYPIAVNNITLNKITEDAIQ